MLGKTMTRYGRWCLGAAAALVVAGGLAEETETHTPIASRWNYNEHLFPIYVDATGTARALDAEDDGPGFGEATVLSPPERAGGLTLAFSQIVGEDVSALAILPEVAVEARDVRVVAVTPGGTRVPMLFLREPDTAWPTRYWFDAPLDLPAGTTIEVNARLHPGADHAPGRSLIGAEPSAAIRLAVDYATAGAPAD